MDLGRLAADYGKADDALEEIRTLFEHRLERLRKYGYIVEKTYEYPQFEAYHGYRISW